jgi:helicase
VVITRPSRLNQAVSGPNARATGAAANAAQAAFELMWQDQAFPVGQASPSAPVPEALAAFLPFSALNPAQAHVMPEILGHDQNLLVVAPTGAGKTVIGMAGCLKAIIEQKRKAA